MSKNKYTKEFKLGAVKLVTEQGYTQAEAAKNLGVDAKNLSRWVSELKKDKLGCSSQTILTAEQEELYRLRKENKRLQMERDILKKAAAFFANEPL